MCEAETGVAPSTIAVAGDSAGGNLALGLAIRIRDGGGPRVGCVVAFSPWTAPADLADVSPGELLLDDARRVRERIRTSGGACDLRIYESVPHGSQMLVPFVPEATHSLREAAKFVDDALT